MIVGRALALLLFLLPASAGAEEWFEAYRAGLKAQAQGQPTQAVILLERAARQHPEPGRNVLTYGTNLEPQYFPYLHLAEAYLQLKDPPSARAALKRSETWGREPAEDRRRLAAQVEDLAASMAAPPPTTAAASSTAPPSATADALPAPMPAASTAPALPPPPLPGPGTATTEPRLPAAEVRRPTPAPAATTLAARDLPLPPAPAPTGRVLEVVSQPPGADVYLDDEKIGTTDPEWGRLVRNDVPGGRHRIRLARAGYGDLVEDIEVAAAGRTDFRRRLSSPESTPYDRRFVWFGAVAVVLLGLTAWALRRPRETTPSKVRTQVPGFDEAAPTPPRGTPPGMGSPGVRRDEKGHEYFGEYRLLEPLGRGGMASVFKVERRGETLALKRPLSAFLEEPEFLERFLREAEIGRTLHHPNIVRILERGEVEGVPFFTMELVPGETLQHHIQRVGALDPRLATRIVVQIAEALDYAHLKGVVHRDLKPSNVMLLADGTAKVMDYGIARARRFEGLTVTGSFLGSPEYVAPEAIEGTSDARSDLYSLGVILYETLTGLRPFTAGTPFAILRMQLTQAPQPPRQLRPGLPADLEAIVLRLLSKIPDQRYASAEDLVLELRDFLNRAA